jgi:Sporulation related domain.
MKKTKTPFAIALLLIVGTLQVLQSQDAKSKSIIETLTSPDSATNATVRIYGDKRIEQLVTNRRTNGNSKQLTMNGFRVQVFSSNSQRTAKTEAFRIERQILDAFPEQGVYVNYVSPFWKVRVGDFRTQAQAHAFRTQLVETLPQFRGEIYIVKEQIFVSSTK